VVHVHYATESGDLAAVRGLDFSLHAGEALAIVGESGSGKSATAMAIMGLQTENAHVEGSILLHGEQLLDADDERLSSLRGKSIAMVFQDPLSSMTPVYTVGEQLVESIQIHQSCSKQAAEARAIELLDMVGIPEPHERIAAYPHEFSGGMRQRVLIAMAIANNPDVIIADEPTTALDVTIQAQILDVLQKACQQTGAALLLITHDLGVVARIADNAMVMYAGKIVEKGSVRALFYDSCMPYTMGLLGSLPDVNVADSDHLVACVHHQAIKQQSLTHVQLYQSSNESDTVPTSESVKSELAEQAGTLLQMSGVKKHYPLFKGGVFRRRTGTVYAVDGIDLTIDEGETLGLVGESGCGKSSTTLSILDLKPPTHGTIKLFGQNVAELKSAPDVAKRVNELMLLVGLDESYLDRFSQQLSGGQCQRICIARALTLKPRLVILDEPVSALDVSIRAGIVNLLQELKTSQGLSYLFVAHDLALVRHIADRVAVMYLGRIVETGSAESVYENPTHPYTQCLLSAMPVPDPDAEANRVWQMPQGELPNPANPPGGCHFHTRCPKKQTLSEDQQNLCVQKPPGLKAVMLYDKTQQPIHQNTGQQKTGHSAACHFIEPDE